MNTLLSQEEMSLTEFSEEFEIVKEKVSKLRTSQKALLLKNKDIVESVEKLVLLGFTLSVDEIDDVHNSNVPVTFYHYFGISSNDFVRTVVLGDNSRTSPLRRDKKILKQIIDVILEDEIDVGVIQNLLILLPNKVLLDDMKKIHEKYNILYQPVTAEHVYANYDCFADLYISSYSDRLVVKSIMSEENISTIEWLLDFGEDWKFSSILSTVITLSNLELTRRMMERGIIPQNIYFRNIVSDIKGTLALICEHLGNEKMYDLLINSLAEFDDYNILVTLETIEYLMEIRGVDYYEVKADIRRRYDEIVE